MKTKKAIKYLISRILLLISSMVVFAIILNTMFDSYRESNPTKEIHFITNHNLDALNFLIMILIFPMIYFISYHYLTKIFNNVNKILNEQD